MLRLPIISAVVFVFVLSACQTTSQAIDATPKIEINITDAAPTYNPGDVLSVSWVCREAQAVRFLAGSPSPEAFIAALKLFVRQQKCVAFDTDIPIKLKMHEYSFDGVFGPGEAWMLETSDGSPVFALLKPAKLSGRDA